MRSYFMQVLVLGCSLFLVLPPGWCCLAADFISQKASVKTVPCCCPCCADKAAPTTPAPAPCPNEPGKCPCGERLSIAPDAFKVFLDGLPSVTLLPAFGSASSGLHEGDGITVHFFPFFSSPHLLNCVWLC